METAERVEAIKIRLKMLKDLVANLNQTIKHEKANGYLLGSVKNTLSSVEAELLPWTLKASTPSNASMFLAMAEFELGEAETRLNYAHHMVTTYGADIQAIGG